MNFKWHDTFCFSFNVLQPPARYREGQVHLTKGKVAHSCPERRNVVRFLKYNNMKCSRYFVVHVILNMEKNNTNLKSTFLAFYQSKCNNNQVDATFAFL